MSSKALITGKIGGGSALTAFAELAAPPTDYINRELGLEIHINRENSLAQAMKDPVVWLEKRNQKLLGTWVNDADHTKGRNTDGINEKVATHYKTKLNEYRKAGYPQEVAMAQASKSSNRLLEEYMEELERDLPGATTVFASAAHQMADRNARFGLATGSAEVNETEIYKRVRASKKAKKARKMAKLIK